MALSEAEGSSGFGEIAERLRRFTVRVSTGRRPGRDSQGAAPRARRFAGEGSGVIVKSDGTIVTNAHVAASASIEVELWDGTRTAANLLARDPSRDLAVLRVAMKGLPAAALADSDRLRVGELVIAIGNPLGFTGALTTGVVHAVGRVPGLGPMKWVQADVRLAPGNSGGPLANARGEVIGINTMVAAGVGLAVPSNAVARALKAKISRAPLGIVARPVEIAVRGAARFGMLVLEIVKGSAAEAASLMLGDILVSIDGRSLDSMDDFERALSGDSDRVIRVQFLRGDRANVRSVAVCLGLQSTAAA
ncbi:MAG TPA: trypsin-like peptidase domain-containing protein [Candidatus Acidoferrales bacterium]